MKILLVTAHFPPKNSIASLRLYSFAKYWYRAGHDITVLTAFENKNQNDLEFDLSFLKIIRVAVPILSKFSYSNPVNAAISQNSKENNGNFLKKIFHSIKKILIVFKDKTGCFNSRFPSLYDLWAKKSLKSIDPHSYDIVLSSGGPYSVHRVGLALKKKNKKIKCIVDWRDLWTKDPNTKGSIIFYPYEVLLERRFHKNADFITTVSEPLNNELIKITSTKVITIYNGFDTDDFIEIQKKERKKNNTYNIVYTGNFYRNLQDISPLFIAILHIKEKDILLFNKIRIQFAGKSADISDIAKKYNISGIYDYLGYIKRDEALELQYNADAVLFVDYKSKTDGILSGKIFEYIYTSKKIIAIGNKADSSAVELIKKTNTGIYLGNNIELIEQHLIECITNTDKNNYIKNDALIQEYTRENQADKLLNSILEIPC